MKNSSRIWLNCSYPDSIISVRLIISFCNITQYSYTTPNKATSHTWDRCGPFRELLLLAGAGITLPVARTEEQRPLADPTWSASAIPIGLASRSGHPRPWLHHRHTRACSPGPSRWNRAATPCVPRAAARGRRPYTCDRTRCWCDRPRRTRVRTDSRSPPRGPGRIGPTVMRGGPVPVVPCLVRLPIYPCYSLMDKPVP